MTMLTRNFRDTEISISDSRPDLVIPFEELAPHLVANAMRVLEGFMQPARDLAGALETLSFIRSQALNDATPGASPTSSHMTGLGCDFRPLRITPALFWAMAQPFDDTLEYSGALEASRATWDKLNIYTGPGTFHVGLRPLEEGPGRRRIYRDWQRIG